MFCFDSDKGKSSKLKAPARNQQQEKVRLNGSDKPSSRQNSSHHGQTESPCSPDRTSRNSSCIPAPTEQVQRSSPVPQVPKDHRRPRAGVSFCFSRRAQLKLDSCASVFNDGLDEASDLQELQRQRQRLALQALWSRSPSPTLSQEDHNDPAAMDSTSLQSGHQVNQQDQEDSLEIQVNYCSAEPEREVCPSSHGPEAEKQPPGPEESAANQGQRYREWGLVERNLLRCPSPTALTPSTMASGQVHTQKALHHDLQNETTLKHDTMTAENCSSETGSGRTFSFLNVLSKDGTLLRWPTELVQYTSDEPRVSYSCNPHCLNFKCAEGQEKGAGEANACAVSGLPDQPDRAEGQAQAVLEDKFGILKPKRPKNRRRMKARRRKLDAVRRLPVGCAFGSQTLARGPFEFKSSPADPDCSKQGHGEKRCKLGKRKRSIRDEVLNKSVTPEQSLKSIVINSFSVPPRHKRKRQKLPSAFRSLKRRAVPPTTAQCTVGGEDNYPWSGNFCRAKRDTSVTPRSDKSGSWGDLSSDGEWAACQWGRYYSPPGSATSYSWRRAHSQPWSYIRKSSYDFPCYGYRHVSDSPGGDIEYREDFWDYRDSEICRERDYSGVCDSPCIIERRYSTQKHKRVLEENRRRHRNSQKLRKKKLCFYRVYDSPEPQNTERGWWCEKPSLDNGRHRKRDKFWLSPEISQSRGFEQSGPGNRLSPASSSTTSISELSGDLSSHTKPTYSVHSQNHHSDLTWTAERPTRTKTCSPSKEKSYSPTCKSIAKLETMQTDSKPVNPSPSAKLEPVTHISNATDLAKQSPSLDKKLTGIRTRTFSLPLIGKLPSIKRGIRLTGIHKDKNSSCSDQGLLKHEIQVVSDTRQSPDRTTWAESCNSNSSQTCQVIADERTTEHCTKSPENLIGTMAETSQTSETQPQRCPTPPLTEQPITFTAEEIDKYRLLQLQAQQHMQQQHLQEQQDMPRQPTHVNHMPIPVPEPSNQSVPIPCLPYNMLQHGPLSAFSSAVASPSSSFASHHSPTAHPPLHPSLSQTHFTPVPFPAAFFTAPPAAVMSARPLHLIPAASLRHHPPGLALHPLPHTALFPAVLAPAPMAAAAMAAASTLQIHPLLHPLFHSQDLQNRSGPAS